MNTKDLEKMIRKYPPPRHNETFIHRWKQMLPKVVLRENFSEAHLMSLEVLCDLYCEYERLRDSLDVTGYTFTNSDSKYGEVVKNYPEVGQLNVCRNQITVYSRMLGLILAKDTTQADQKEEKDQWS